MRKQTFQEHLRDLLQARALCQTCARAELQETHSDRQKPRSADAISPGKLNLEPANWEGHLTEDFDLDPKHLTPSKREQADDWRKEEEPL